MHQAVVHVGGGQKEGMGGKGWASALSHFTFSVALLTCH